MQVMSRHEDRQWISDNVGNALRQALLQFGVIDRA